MNNQNNPYPDVSDQPLLGNQQRPPQPQPHINNPYPINQPQNQGYMPNNQGYQRILIHIQHRPHLPSILILSPIHTTKDLSLILHFLEQDWCVQFAEDRLITSQRKYQEGWHGYGVSACSFSQEFAAVFLSALIPVWTPNWFAWSVNV